MGPGHVSEQPALTPPRRRGRRWLLCLGVVGILVGLLVWFHPLLLAGAARWLDISEPPTAVDDVMVLGGDSSVRPFVAAALYNKGLAKRVLIPTVKPGPGAEEGLYPTDDDVIYKVLVQRGVPADAIVRLPGEVDSTADEAASLKRYLADKPDDTVTIVTTCYHTRRVRWIFQKQLGERASQFHFLGAPTERFDAANWWRSEQGNRLYVQEYVKFAFYLFKY